MAKSDLKIWGIRHHGPGSAKALLTALEAYQPDCILIEAPEDAQNLVKYIANEGLQPPVAMLLYNAKNLGQAAYFPFAVFSPEWQTAKWALSKNAELRFFDLPMSIQFSLSEDKEKQQQVIDFQQNTAERSEDFFEKIIDQKLDLDPLAHLARLAGYTDSERWWEVHFEQTAHPTAVFNTILEMMQALRTNLNRPETPETLMREAFMRRHIRQARKEGFERIAVVCGAWHAPVLAAVDAFKDANDAAILRGVKKTTTKATWAAWSFDRLSRASGYAAGVVSPAWYSLLFEQREAASARWLTRAAQLLRAEDLNASSANIIEAVKLADTLAYMRSRQIAGLEELEEAALTCLTDGNTAPLSIVRQKLSIGDVVGRVPSEIPQVPLLHDIEACIKAARLTKEYETSLPTEKVLDLRKETQLNASYLLHRLDLLGINWGKVQSASRYQLGSFSEKWVLHWLPDFAIRIIERAMWGNTVEVAANQYLTQQLPQIENLKTLAELTDKTLKAHLTALVPTLLVRLRDVAALTQDVLVLMDALPPLVRIVRYGNVRKTDGAAVAQVLDALIPRICVGLPSLCENADDAACELIFNKLQNTNSAISLLSETEYTEGWVEMLKKIALPQVQAHPKLAGLSIRILFEKNIISLDKAAIAMRFALSKKQEIRQSAAWIEGFLNGSGLLLIHHIALWQMLNEWVGEIEMTELNSLLPVLRRSFANFTPAERRKMLEMATKSSTNIKTHTVDTPQNLDIKRVAIWQERFLNLIKK